MKERKFPYRTKQEFYENVSKEPLRELTNSYNLNKVGRLMKAINKYF